MSTTKHRHKFEKIVEWITEPRGPDDDKYWGFTVMRACECGATKRGESEPSEVEEFIRNLTCAGCGGFRVNHESQSVCIKDLHSRVKYLEKRLEKVCDALSGIGRVK